MHLDEHTNRLLCGRLPHTQVREHVAAYCQHVPHDVRLSVSGRAVVELGRLQRGSQLHVRRQDCSVRHTELETHLFQSHRSAEGDGIFDALQPANMLARDGNKYPEALLPLIRFVAGLGSTR